MSQCLTWIYLLIALNIAPVSSSVTAPSLPDTAYVQFTDATLAEVKNCSFPNDVTATVTLGADIITLNLHKNDHVSSGVPVLVIKETSTGSTTVEPYKFPLEQNYGLYQDQNHSASIELRCPEAENSPFVIEGTFLYGGHTLRLTHLSRRRRDVSSTNSTDEYNLVVEEDVPATNADFKQPPADAPLKAVKFEDFLGKPLAAAPPGRRRRQSSSPYFVDVVAVLDFAVYRDWYQRSEQTEETLRVSETLSNMRRYFALIMNGVDLRYQSISTLPYRINIRLIGYVVATTSGAARWTEDYKVMSSPRYVVNADTVLTAFSDWAAAPDSLPAYDHAVLFTGYDLFTIAGTTMKTATTGLAYIGTLCSLAGKSVSVVEETGAFVSTETTAHEIGHSLNAKHDGDANTCSSTDRYIMAAGGEDAASTSKVNSWYFSSCSVDYFKNFINNMMRTSRGVACLTTALPVINVPDVNVLPGQLYDPDAQCRQLHGSGSRLCRGPEFGTAASICTSMYCYDPSTSKTCYEHVAARGTSCGDQKWCINGQCVYSPDAPRKDESCVFGDQEGLAFDNKDCATFVAGYPGYCYQEVVRGRCCSTCSQYYLPLSNCEYGDKVAGCRSSGCGYVYQDGSLYDEKCCGTCKYGTPLSTTIRPVVTQTSASTTTTSPPVCEDSRTILLNGQQCALYLQSNAAACYDSSLRALCCASCLSLHSGVNGCEYGDRVSQCQAAGCGFVFNDGSSYDDVCCGTCGNLEPVTLSTTSSTTTSSTTLSTTTATTTSMTTTTRSTTPSTTTTTTASTTPSTTTTGCEYGDRDPVTCTSLLAGKTSCSQSLRATCCATCAAIENVNAQAALTSHTCLWLATSLALLRTFLL